MQEKNINITQFTDKYEYTNHITRKLMDNFFNNIKSLCPNNLKKVMEVGCGAGYSTRILYDYIKPENFNASDIDPELVKMMLIKNPNVIGSTESIYQLSHNDNTFDIVFTLEVLEHLENPDKALSELSRITKKYAIISVPNEPIWRILNLLRFKYIKNLGNTPGHINHWSKKTLNKKLENYFIVKKIKAPLPWLVALVEKK